LRLLLDGLVLLLGDSSLLLPQLMCGPVILRKGGKEKKEIGDEKLPLFPP
jgi:hypothetical protein